MDFVAQEQVSDIRAAARGPCDDRFGDEYWRGLEPDR
jgi:hypothetical protein